MPSIKFEKQFTGVVCGIDEAGRGPWAGPVVAAAVILGNKRPRGINDSKLIPEPKREALYEKLIKTCLYGVGSASVEEIDRFNIIQATKLAMLRAYEVLAVDCDHALIDGNQLPQLPCRMQYIIGGDGISFHIAAASIIAKVTRDRILRQLHEEFPHYGWASNKGYGCRVQWEAVEKYGVCVHHRRTWSPVRAQLELELEEAI